MRRLNFLISLTLQATLLTCETSESKNDRDDFFFTDISPERSLLWGPGLKPDVIVLPCRYFFVQLVNGGNQNVTKVIPGEKPSVSIEGFSDPSGTGRRCRAWTEVLDRKDGSFVVRYKFHSSCYDVVLSVSWKGEHVGESPVKVAGVVHPDTCNCPDKSLAKWMEQVGCPAPPRRMEEDLAKWKDGVDVAKGLENAKKLFDNPGAHAWCHYAIVENEVHRKCYGQHIGFSMFWDAVLGWLVRRARLPDNEMLVNLGDWPLVRKGRAGKIPMFSWCGSADTDDVLFPTYEITEASLECMGRQSLDILAIQGKNGVAWEDKEEVLFWRGRDSRKERLKLAEMSLKNPELINASITAYFFFRQEQERLGKSKAVSFFDFFNYKYQLNIDGTVAAYRFPYLLAGDAVVFKQESTYSEHFYSDVEPWIHYIPVASDLSDLEEKIKWAKEHDEKARIISKNGRLFAEQNLMPLNIVCYHAQLLQRWSELLVDKVKVGEDMELVELEKGDDRFPPCNCDLSGENFESVSPVKDEL